MLLADKLAPISSLLEKCHPSRGKERRHFFLPAAITLHTQQLLFEGMMKEEDGFASSSIFTRFLPRYSPILFCFCPCAPNNFSEVNYRDGWEKDIVLRENCQQSSSNPPPSGAVVAAATYNFGSGRLLWKRWKLEKLLLKVLLWRKKPEFFRRF